MFSISLVTLDSYQSAPLPELDVTFSDFRGTVIRHVPVIRIFGSTPFGVKTCLHIHGVFPYMYVPCTIEKSIDSFIYKLAAAMDSAINVSLGSAMSNTQHVYNIQRVSGIPFYGYHEKEHLFFKIYFYNPAMIKRAADLLQSGVVLNQSLQPHEAHIPFILQFMMDYNLYGMSLINLKDVKHRQLLYTESKEHSLNLSDSQKYLPASVLRQSTCKLEVDAHASAILRQEIQNGLDLNPGIAAIWNDENCRREAKGLKHTESQLLYTNTNDRVYGSTDNDIYQEERLARRLQAVSQINETPTSVTPSTLSYPLEVGNEEEENKKEPPLNSELLELEKSYSSVENLLREESVDASILDTEDLHLVEMLANLAEANLEEKIVDNDSVLGSQCSTYSNEVKEDNEDDDVEDLNITSLDLDSLSSWNSVSKGPSQSSVSEMENKYAECNKETAGTVENNTEDALLNFPQYDGSTDLLLNNGKEFSRKSDTTEISKEKSLCKELLNKNIISSQLNFTNILKRSDFLQKVIGFEFILNEGIKRKIYEILYERYSSKFIAFNAELFSKNAHNCIVNVKLRQNQTREFKSKRRKATQAFKQNSLYPRSKNMLNTCKLDHKDLDVYDLEGIELALSSGDYTNLKHIVNESCSNRISCGDSLSVELKVPALDGNTIESSSDSELDQDLTIDRQERRICVYKSCTKSKKNEENVVNVSLKKRRLEFDHPELESPHKRRNTNSLQDESDYTPTKSRTVRSPRSLSGKYTPLDVRILSPKADRNASLGNDPGSSRTYSASPCTTPSRASRQLRMNLLREKVFGLSPDVKQAHPISNEAESTKGTLVLGKLRDSAGVNEEATDSKNKEGSTVNIKDKSNKEVRKRLNFLNVNEKKIDPVKDNIDESEHLALTEEIMNESRENASANVSIMNFTHHQSVMKTYMGEDEKVNDEDKTLDLRVDSFSDETLQANEEGNIEAPLDDEEDVCDMTFTQYLSKKLESESDVANVLSVETTSDTTKDKLITITTKFNPPSRERIVNSMKMYDISGCKSTAPFFSNRVDLIKQEENSRKNSSLSDSVPFKSSLERVTSIKLWRRVKINEFYPSGANIKSCNIKRVLAGYNSIVIQPLIQPPTPKCIKTWLRAKEYLLKKSKKHTESKSDPSTAKDTKVEKTHSSDSNNEKTEEHNTVIETIADNNEHAKVPSQVSNTSEYSSGSNHSMNPSLQKMLENPLLYKNKETQYLGISFGQIEYSMKGHTGNVADENLQNVRGLTVHQYLTLLSVEVHVVTRGKLLPDPEHDSIEAIFYAIHNDVPLSSHMERMEHGAILVNPSIQNSKVKNIYSSSTTCPASYVSSEEDLFNSLVTLIRHYDPDILVGWEIESLSWGYIQQRASRINFNNFIRQISRISNVPNPKGQETDKDNVNDMKVPGRIILDAWRIMRHETALLNYTFENVMYNVMRERISCPTFQTLTDWWKHKSIMIQWRVITHYVTRVVSTLKILIQHDIIGRTCEHARLFGIQFYEVFSRGSQFRVESMMLRLVKPLNYIPISPSIQQRAQMRAPEALPLIMEPQSVFYADPLIVLDFQSLYPSIIIAYNYCFSTCLGRVEHIGHHEPYEFGAATLRLKRSRVQKLKGKINFSPCGVAFVKPEVRQGILPRMLTEILETRLMVKESMKLHKNDSSVLQRILHSQQLGLKLIANVTYGYTAANFSGRMPCIEIADSVVSKGRETLERAIKIVESTAKWGAQVVYGDTDSLFILLPGRSRKDAFVIGAEMAETITAANPPPVKLKFEKVLQPSLLQTKKRYCGYMYESPEQEEPEYLGKGIETVRRDGCPAVAKILEKSLKILFDTKDLSLIKLYVTRQFDKILRRKISIQDLTFAKEFRGLRGYKANACVPALALTRRLIRKDPRAVPRTGERVRYVIVAGAPNQALIHCVRTPMEVISDEGLTPNSVYYITKAIIPPLNRCLNLIGVDVNTWYREMSHRQTPDKAVSLFTDNQKLTIRQFFSTIVCATCEDQTQRDICTNCMANPTRTVTILHEKLRWLERTHCELTMICQSCTGYKDDVKCESLDCPILYRAAQARRDLIQIPYLNSIISNSSNFCTGETNTR
ncbi:DNA polymerase zeta catalytic subunit isoform X1 [Andrena cerasifolii]|uniref:DNA polymerase zeta catalytic subunit isoform X1 n=1 Tax=Andrena cerasifolii TaxID=2819439 RepID=UPI0040381414